MKWIFFDLGATLVDESDVYKSRCEYAIRQLSIDLAEFMNKVYEEAKLSPTPIRTAAKAYGVVLPPWDSSLEKLYEATHDVVRCLYGKYKLGIIANQVEGTQERIDSWGIGKYFDVVMASAEAGCAKPDLKIFYMALDKAEYAFVENVVTHADHRGKGYAGECLAYAKQIAEQENCYKMMLLTGSKKPETLHFYEKAGYNSSDKTAFIQWIGMEK